RSPGETVVFRVDRGADVRIALGESPTPWSALVATALATILLVLGLIARIGRPDDRTARRFYWSTILYATLYCGTLSWPKLIVHPLLAIVFLGSLFAGPKIALDLALEFPQAATRTARRISLGAGVLSAVLGLGCAIALGIAIRDFSVGDAGLVAVVVFI